VLLALGEAEGLIVSEAVGEEKGVSVAVIVLVIVNVGAKVALGLKVSLSGIIV